MTIERQYTSRRTSIVESLVELLKQIDGTGDYLSNVFDNVYPTLKFWDEVSDFPAIHISAGSESREYQTGGYKDRFLSITLRCYVQEEEPQIGLNNLLEDIETLLEENSSLEYSDRQNTVHRTHQITIVSIETDEGVLDPLGVGEMLIEVRY